MADNTGGSFVLTTKANFKSLYEGLENVLEKLEGVERSYKDKISTINTNANGISFQGWSDDIATSFSTYIDDFKKDYFNKIETDIVGGNFVDLLKRIDELKEGVGKCATTQDAIDSTEETMSHTDKKVWVNNTKKKKDTDPDQVQVDNPTYTSLVNELNRLKGDLDDEISDCNGIARQIALIEFGKDYEYTPYQFTDTTLDDAQFQDPNTTTTIDDLGNGQFRKTITTVMPDGTTIVQVIVYYDRDGNGVPDEGMPYTENTYMEDVPPEGQQQVVDDTLEGTGLDVTVDGEDTTGADTHPWKTYEDAVGTFPGVITYEEWYKYERNNYESYQAYLDAMYAQHGNADTTGADTHPWQSYEDAVADGFHPITQEEWYKYERNNYESYQAYLDAEYAKYHAENPGGANSDSGPSPSITVPTGVNVGDVPIPGTNDHGGIKSTETTGPTTTRTYEDGTIVQIVSDPAQGENVLIFHPDGTTEGYERLADGTWAYRTYTQSERAYWMGSQTGAIVVNPDKSVTVTTFEGGQEHVTTYKEGEFDLHTGQPVDNTIHIAGLESATSVDTHDPYDPNFGNTSTAGQVRVVDGTQGETIGQIRLDTTIYGPGGSVEGVQNNGTTTFALGDNGNSGTLTYDHPGSHFDCNLTYNPTDHTVTETVNDNGREVTRTVPYIAETYEISTPSGTYEVTINPNTDAGKLFLSDYVANLGSNQDSGQRMGSDLAYDAIAMSGDTTSVSSESLGFTITLKTQEFYRPDGSYASHDFATGETTTLVPAGSATPSVPSSNPGSSSRDSAGVTDFTGSSGTHHTGSGGSFGDPAVGDAGGGTYTGGGGGGGGTPYYTFTADGGNGLPGPFNK